jgi:hypothetical protein
VAPHTPREAPRYLTTISAQLARLDRPARPARPPRRGRVAHVVIGGDGDVGEVRSCDRRLSRATRPGRLAQLGSAAQLARLDRPVRPARPPRRDRVVPVVIGGDCDVGEVRSGNRRLSHVTRPARHSQLGSAAQLARLDRPARPHATESLLSSSAATATLVRCAQAIVACLG